jgi:hypothetical protein
MIQFVMEKMKPVIEMMQKKSEEWADMNEDEDEKKPKKKRSFGRRK